jgi:hypothetical protein
MRDGCSDLLKKNWPPLWPSGQSFWLQIQRSGFHSQRYQIFWVVVGLERDPLSLVCIIMDLRGRKRRGSRLENRRYTLRDTPRWPSGSLYPKKLALTSPTCGVRSVGIVRSQTQAMEFFFNNNFISQAGGRPMSVLSQLDQITYNAKSVRKLNKLQLCHIYVFVSQNILIILPYMRTRQNTKYAYTK